MTVIRRREIDEAADGTVYAERTHELHDDGRGVTSLVRRNRTARCPVCSSSVASQDALRGRCQRCGRGPMCVVCVVRCVACNRDICPMCRDSHVWARIPLTVCRGCRRKLGRRAVIEQRLALGREGFRRFTFRQRLSLQLNQIRHRQRMELLRSLIGVRQLRGRRGRIR